MAEEMTWEKAGAMLVAMRQSGWEITLSAWEGNKGWKCDAQVGTKITDPDFFNEADDPLEAIRLTFEQVFEYTVKESVKTAGKGVKSNGKANAQNANA